jgi:serine/threonine-protein kinase ATR
MRLAQSRKLSARQLFEPFWRSLAFSAVKDLGSRPKLTELIADLMEMSITDFILYVHRHAMPWLVLTGKQVVIERIAEARQEKEPWQPVLDNANLGPILALLLIQDVPDIQSYIMTLLRHISPHFDGLDLVQLLQMDSLTTTLELLKAAGDADASRKAHVSARYALLNPFRANSFSRSVVL